MEYFLFSNLLKLLSFIRAIIGAWNFKNKWYTWTFFKKHRHNLCHKSILQKNPFKLGNKSSESFSSRWLISRLLDFNSGSRKLVDFRQEVYLVCHFYRIWFETEMSPQTFKGDMLTERPNHLIDERMQTKFPQPLFKIIQYSTQITVFWLTTFRIIHRCLLKTRV